MAALEDKSGTNVGFGNAAAENIKAGQTAKAELTGVPTGPAKGLDVRITEVQRTAS